MAGNPSTPPDVLDSLLPSNIDSPSDVEIALAVVRNAATGRRTRERGPLLRRFAEDLIGAGDDDLLALIDDTATSGTNRHEFGPAGTELIFDRSGGYAYLSDEQGQAGIAVEVLRSWARNIAAVSPRLRDRIRADFGAGSLTDVLWALGWLPSSKWPPSERLPAAAILFARGNWYQLMDFVHEARIDWRDALIAGGLQHEDWRERLNAELA